MCLTPFPSIMKKFYILNFLTADFVVNVSGIILEDLASSICSDDLETKGQIRMYLIHCSPNQQIKMLSFLFGCELVTNKHISDSKSVVAFVDNDEPLPVISSLMLPKFPLQVPVAKLLPVQPAARCQVREQQQAQVKNQEKKKLRISHHPALGAVTFVCACERLRYSGEGCNS
jgi:hypothetical protein